MRTASADTTPGTGPPLPGATFVRPFNAISAADVPISLNPDTVIKTRLQLAK
jgi:hypothetical protein